MDVDDDANTAHLHPDDWVTLSTVAADEQRRPLLAHWHPQTNCLVVGSLTLRLDALLYHPAHQRTRERCNPDGVKREAGGGRFVGVRASADADGRLVFLDRRHKPHATPGEAAVASHRAALPAPMEVDLPWESWQGMLGGELGRFDDLLQDVGPLLKLRDDVRAARGERLALAARFRRALADARERFADDDERGRKVVTLTKAFERALKARAGETTPGGGR
jgi:hypothetical protein